jgi:hypothetical protein
MALSAAKAKKILEDGYVKSKPLTAKQKKYFGAIADGATPLKKLNGGWLDKFQNGGDVSFDSVQRAIRNVESLDGKLMWNPESTATGLYGQLFSQVKDDYSGTRKEFAQDTISQKKFFKDRFFKGLPSTQTTSLVQDANDIYNEYAPQISNFNYSKEDLAVLSNFLGRQGTREYLGYHVRDNQPLEKALPNIYGSDAKQRNKTPEQYLKQARKYYKEGGWLDKFDNGGVQPNYNDSNVSLPPGFKGWGYDKGGRAYNGAWNGPVAQEGIELNTKYIDSTFNANMDKRWVQRLYERNPEFYLEGQTKPSTHFMESGDGYVYPRVMEGADGQLKEVSREEGRSQGIKFPNDEIAQWFAKNYKKGTNVLKEYQMGGSLSGATGMMYARTSGTSPEEPKKAQDGTVMYGTPEYEAAYREGRFADVPNVLDEVVITSGVDYNQYPLYDKLSAQQKEYFNDPGPIGRGVRRAAQTDRGLAEDTYDVVNPIMYGALGVAGGMMAGPSIATLGRAAAPYASRYALSPIQKALNYKPLGGPVSVGNVVDVGSAAYAAYATPEAYDKFKENPSFDTGLDLGLTAIDLVPFGEIFTGGKNIRKAYNYTSNQISNIFKAKPSKVVDNAWAVKPLPGLHLKSTMDNGAISKIIESKTGLINTEQALAIINKESGGAEKVALIRQQLGDNIPKKIDYNDFRKITQESLIPLEVKINPDGRAPYGLDHIGYGEYWDDGKKRLAKNLRILENNALTISNRNQFGGGSSMHGNPDDTLGHVHFLRDVDNPQTLTVTQIQSDAFQGGYTTMPKTKEAANFNIAQNEKHLENQKRIWNSAVQQPDSSWLYPDGTLVPDGIHKLGVQGQESINAMQRAEAANLSQKQLLQKNHQERYLQEIVNYAAQRGDLNKVRIPTMETAAKIQNYTPNMPGVGGGATSSGFNLSDYGETEQSILKKYKDQSKNIKNLYGQDAIIVTDGKGNTWYEFDIPESFKSGKGEIKAFKEGGEIDKAQDGGWLDKFQEGGVIEDDRGQWAYPGEITKINSNNITMKGVNYPVLGVSDTGDTKMMQPGKDYKFKGNSVTEYPMAQEGAGVNKEGVKQYKWFKNYMRSPKYKERLKKEFPDYNDRQIEQESKSRLQNVMQTRVGFLPLSSKYSKNLGSIQGFYDHDAFPGAIMLRPEYSASTSDEIFEPGNYLSGYNTIPLHEWSHAADDGGNKMPQSTTDLMLSKMKENFLDIPKDKYYYTKPTEYLGRMQPLRYLMQQEGLYDAGTQDFTKEDLENAKQNKTIKNNQHFQDLMENVKSDEDFIELMNKVASVNQKDNSRTMIAKDGKSLVELNQLTNFTNYNTPQPGGWLDKYH